MRLGIILNTNNHETAWNALRLGSQALDAKHEVGLFLLGSGVEVENIKSETFDIANTLEKFLSSGGKILACGNCLKLRHQQKGVCPVSTMSQLVDLIAESDKVVTMG